MIVTVDMVMGEIRKEMQRAVDLHGPLSTNHERALRILVEEVGEASMAIHDLLRPTQPGDKARDLRQLESEVIQIAATAVRWAMNVEEEAQR